MENGIEMDWNVYVGLVWHGEGWNEIIYIHGGEERNRKRIPVK